MSMWRAGLLTIVLAMAVSEIPRMARLLYSIALSVREEPYVEAAVALNMPTWKILWRHILSQCRSIVDRAGHLRMSPVIDAGQDVWRAETCSRSRSRKR